jgi:hypothetical protein
MGGAEKATDEGRHAGEKARDWRRRRQRAAQAIARAQAADAGKLEPLAMLLEDPAP